MPPNAAQQWLVRLRWPILILAGVLLIIGYNGQWRVGRDSALYRAVGENLAQGNGYTFRGERQKHIYPGLPYLLAGVEKVFGKQDALRPWAAQGVMLALALLTLLATYHLVRAYFAEWIAVCVTFGVAVNWQFAQYAHELMSDVPFLLGVVLTLLGIAWLSDSAAKRRRKAWGAGFILLGAVLAITMRPTFFALAVAVVGALGVGIVRWRGTRWYLWAGLGAVVLLVALFLAVDPRAGKGEYLGGKYERQVRRRLSNLGEIDWAKRRDAMLCAHLPDAVFAFEVPKPWGWFFSALVIGCGVAVMTRSTLWGFYVVVTVVMTALLGARPRYYLMILPMLLVGWALWADFLARQTARIFPRSGLAPSAILLFWLGVATVPNLIKDSGLLLQQRGYLLGAGKVSFVESYRKGRMKQVVDLSQAIGRHVPPGQRVLGIEPRIATYLSGRWVYQPEDVLRGKRPKRWRGDMQEAGIGYLVYGEPGKVQSPGKFGTKLLRYKVVRVEPASEVKVGELRIGKVMYQKSKKKHSPARAAKPQPGTKPTAKPSTKPIRESSR